MNKYRYWANHDPEVAAARNEQAAIYRRLRKTDLTIARLLYVRTKKAYTVLANMLTDDLYSTGNGTGLNGF